MQTQTINSQGQAMAELQVRIAKLEDATVIDPNVPTLEARVKGLEILAYPMPIDEGLRLRKNEMK